MTIRPYNTLQTMNRICTCTIALTALLLIIFIYCTRSSTHIFVAPFVDFKDEHLLSEYSRQNILHDQNNGKLVKCASNGKKCQTIYYKLPYHQTNDPNSTILTVNKAATNWVLQRNHFPIPPYIYLSKSRALNTTPHELTTLLHSKKITFPVVLKPVTGFGGQGVKLNVNTLDSCMSNMRKLISDDEFGVIIQNQIEGHHYRILMVHGEVVDILEDVPPRIEGDGRKTVMQLIRNFNENRKKQGKSTTDVIHWDYIAKQLQPFTKNTTTHFVLPKGASIELTKLKNGYNGVDRLQVPLHRVPQRLKTMFARAASVLGLNMIGIDYMASDIRRPDSNGYIIEVNSKPDYKPHSKLEGANHHTSRRFVNALFLGTN